MKVSLIIPCFKRPNLLRLGLWSIAQQDISYPFEVIVLNDGIEDDTKKVCEEYKDKLDIKYIFTGQRNLKTLKIRCPAFAYNIGIKQAKGDIIILSSPEIFHLNNNIDLIVKSIIQNPKLLSSPENVYIDTIGKAKDYLLKIQTSTLSKDIISSLESNTKRCRYARKIPCFMGIMKKELINIGAYDEDFTGYAGEDDDLIWRLRLNGLNFNFCNGGKIIHLYHDKCINKQDLNSNKDYLYNLKLLRERRGTIKRNVGKDWGKL